MLKATKQSYLPKAKDIGDLEIKVDTLTVDAYVDLDDKIVLVAVRGTKPTEMQDILADIKIALGGLKNSTRFQKDSKIFGRILQRYPPEEGFRYFLSGHSLGGAIVNLFVRQFPFIERAETFNGAAQFSDIGHPDIEDKVFKWYVDKDPLYRLMGWRFNNKKIIPFQREMKNFMDFFLPSSVKAHGLKNFDRAYQSKAPFKF